MITIEKSSSQYPNEKTGLNPTESVAHSKVSYKGAKISIVGDSQPQMQPVTTETGVLSTTTKSPRDCVTVYMRLEMEGNHQPESHTVFDRTSSPLEMNGMSLSAKSDPATRAHGDDDINVQRFCDDLINDIFSHLGNPSPTVIKRISEMIIKLLEGDQFSGRGSSSENISTDGLRAHCRHLRVDVVFGKEPDNRLSHRMDSVFQPESNNDHRSNSLNDSTHVTQTRNRSSVPDETPATDGQNENDSLSESSVVYKSSNRKRAIVYRNMNEDPIKLMYRDEGYGLIKSSFNSNKKNKNNNQNKEVFQYNNANVDNSYSRLCISNNYLNNCLNKNNDERKSHEIYKDLSYVYSEVESIYRQHENSNHNQELSQDIDSLLHIYSSRMMAHSEENESALDMLLSGFLVALLSRLGQLRREIAEEEELARDQESNNDKGGYDSHRDKQSFSMTGLSYNRPVYISKQKHYIYSDSILDDKDFKYCKFIDKYDERT